MATQLTRWLAVAVLSAYLALCCPATAQASWYSSTQQPSVGGVAELTAAAATEPSATAETRTEYAQASLWDLFEFVKDWVGHE